jgi:hypothetical protein
VEKNILRVQAGMMRIVRNCPFTVKGGWHDACSLGTMEKRKGDGTALSGSIRSEPKLYGTTLSQYLGKTIWTLKTLKLTLHSVGISKYFYAWGLKDGKKLSNQRSNKQNARYTSRSRTYHSHTRRLLSSDVVTNLRFSSTNVIVLTAPRWRSYSWTISPDRTSHWKEIEHFNKKKFINII